MRSLSADSICKLVLPYDKKLRQIGQMNSKRMSHAACYRSGQIYICGGVYNDKALNSFERYDSKSGVSENLSHCLFPSLNCTLIPLGGAMLLKLGGVNELDDPVETIELYNLHSHGWIELKF